ncbi:MAG: ABC transporter substrate-binding protein [Nostoc sp.]|uniref:ABC transporter substrate-binding protein n=1 Tax=Nostoc sp. TaxID=1180 RepID=UPI002FFC467F
MKRLQELLVLRDEDIKPIEDRIRKREDSTTLGDKDKDTVKREDIRIRKQSNARTQINPRHTQNNNFLQYIVASVIGVVIGGTVVYFFRTGDKSQPVVQPIVNSCAKETYILNDRISLGEEILLKQDTNPDKEAGANAFLESKCQTAIDKFNLYRKANLTDPEALIYLNNAKARQQGKWLKIAVSVPTDLDPNLAKEILRGVAQAQDEVNKNNGIDSKLLQVAIANDDEKPGTAKKIAEALAKDQEVLGVVGAASSNATIEAGEVYNNERLVAISPTSTAVNISNFRPYVFRTVPNDQVAAKELANYMVKNLQKNKAAVFFNSSNLYSKSLKDEFVTAVQKKGGQVSPENQFDLNSYNFDAETAVKQAISQGAVLMLISDSETLKKAYEVIQANNHKLHIFGGDNIFSLETLNSRGKQAEGMVVAVPWYIGNASNLNFVNNSKKLWKATVNWRTATAYDATLAIAEGLKQSNTREDLQKALHEQSFSIDGATGNIHFLESGDRKDNPIFLVKIQQKPGIDEYEFALIKR